MATRKKSTGRTKGKAKPRRKAPVAKPALRKRTLKGGKKPARKAPVRRASPVKARAAARPAAKPTAAAPPARPAAVKPAPARPPAPPAAPQPAPTPPPQPAPPGERIGVVTHYYSHLSVAIVRLESGTLRVGDTIHIRGHTSDFSQRVQSLEIDHKPVMEAGPNDEFGLKVIAHAREHDVVYKVRP
jgi:putative protease